MHSALIELVARPLAKRLSQWMIRLASRTQLVVVRAVKPYLFFFAYLSAVRPGSVFQVSSGVEPSIVKRPMVDVVDLVERVGRALSDCSNMLPASAAPAPRFSNGS